MRPAYFYDVIKSVQVKIIMTRGFNPPFHKTEVHHTWLIYLGRRPHVGGFHVKFLLHSETLGFHF